MRKLGLKLWRDLRQQKWQFIALTLIILLGVTTYGAMIGMIDDVVHSIQETLDRLAFQDVSLTLYEPLPAGLVDKVAGVEGVQAVVGRLVLDTGLYLSAEEQVHARLVGMPLGEQPPVNQLYVQEGRYLRPGDGLVAVLDHHFADYHGYGPGTVLHPLVNGEQLDVEVVGVAVSPEYLMAVASAENPLPSPSGFAVLFVPQEELQRQFGLPGMITDLSVRLAEGSPVDAAIERLKDTVGATAVASALKGEDNPSYTLLMADLEGGREMIGAVPAMFLTVAALSIYVFLSRMVQAQRPQVGVLKALGYSRWAVLRHYLSFSLLVGLVGSVVGFALSYPLGMAFSRAYAAEFGLPFVVVQFHVGAAVQAIAINLFFCLLAGIFPAWRSAGMAPARAIRFDPSVAMVKGSVPLLERLLGRLFHLRVSTRIALRNLFRNRRRTLTTVLGFVFSLVVLLACWAMFDGLGYMLRIQFEETDRWDLQAVFMQPQADALLEEVRGWPGVRAVEPVLQFPVTLESETARQEAFLTAIDPDTELHGFRLPRGRTPAQALVLGHLLIPPQMGDKLGVETGDKLTVQTPFGAQQVTVEASNSEVMGVGVYVSRPWLEQLSGGQSLYNGLLLRVDEDQWGEVRRRLYLQPDVAEVSLKEEIVAGWRSLMGLYYVMMGLFLVFALIISGAVIFNTMTVNVLERQREIATMRALGERQQGLRGMITLENMLIGLLSLVPGLGLGILATYYLFQLFTTSADFYLPFHISPQTYLIVVGLVFVTAWISQGPAVRRVARMDLAEATKVMT